MYEDLVKTLSIKTKMTTFHASDIHILTCRSEVARKLFTTQLPGFQRHITAAIFSLKAEEQPQKSSKDRKMYSLINTL